MKNCVIAPIEIGEELGEISIFLEEELLKNVKLIAESELKRVNTREYLTDFIKNKLKYIEFIL